MYKLFVLIAAFTCVYPQEYEVSNLYDSSLALSDQDDGMLQPVMHILHDGDNSEPDDFDVPFSDGERYKLVDDMSEDFTVDPADLQELTDSDGTSDDASSVSVRMQA